MSKPNHYFKIFECCIPVKGFSRSIIYDLQRHTFYYISNGLYDILRDCNELAISDIFEKYAMAGEGLVQEYFDFMVRSELGFFTDAPQSFPQIDLHFESPEKINNAILDLDEHSDYDMSSILTQLEDLGCRYIQVRSYCEQSLINLQSLLSGLTRKRFRNVDLITKAPKKNYPEDAVKDFFSRYPVIGNITLHSADKDAILFDFYGRTYMSIAKTIHDETCCGVISKNSFIINIETFTESQHANACLNKKISIDRFGNIKNCPSLKSDYGSIGNTALAEVLAKNELQKFWKIRKDQIDTCKDCEYRYMCSDCRAFLANDKSSNKPFKCKYNPYTTNWEN